MLRSGLRKLGSYFLSLSENTVKPAAAGRSASPAASGLPERFERNSRPMTVRRSPDSQALLAASVQLLGMNEIRRSLGDRWDSVAGIAYRVANRVIHNHLDEGDSFEQQDSETFVLCFGRLKKPEAERRARTIATEIKAALEREAPDLKIRVEQTVAELDWDTVEVGGASIADSIADALHQVRNEAELAARAWRQDLLKGATVLYSSIWNPKQRIVSSYRCLLDEATGQNALQRLGKVSGAEELLSTLSDLDCLMLGRAIQALHLLLKRGGTAQILIPVNFNALCDRSCRETYLKLCRDIPESYRQFVLFEVHGAPPSAPITRITEVALTLKPFSKGVVLEFSPTSTRLQDLAGSGVLGISFDARLFGNGTGDTLGRMTRVVATARAANLKSFFENTDTLGLLEAAVKAQVDYVCGRAITSPMTEPKNSYHWGNR